MILLYMGMILLFMGMIFSMEWINYVSYFLGGAFLANAIPHFVSGTMGRPFQSPFAKPPGQGLSSSTVNVLWGSFNMAVGYVLVFRVGAFDLRCTGHVLATGLGAISVALMLARRFGRFHGGNSPLLAHQNSGEGRG
jgi:hypothetical protein